MNLTVINKNIILVIGVIFLVWGITGGIPSILQNSLGLSIAFGFSALIGIIIIAWILGG